ncbi:hypothetical protein Plec18167_006979 [Paecilomyces lecythidis]|uniref:Uncharacterized protein n=1 Tax=Paecilomyces lecythidis TaxID=3004212 RepID=A0ABR3X7V4_9EURO
MADPSSTSKITPSSPSPTRRHWNGAPGDRHEHHNVWLNGGVKGPATAAPWKLDPPAEGTEQRRTSDASTSSNSSNRRKSSTAGLFSNLTTLKRDSPDPASVARRQSFNDQIAKGGVFSKWWDGYTRGP